MMYINSMALTSNITATDLRFVLGSLRPLTTSRSISCRVGHAQGRHEQDSPQTIKSTGRSTSPAKHSAVRKIRGKRGIDLRS